MAAFESLVFGRPPVAGEPVRGGFRPLGHGAPEATDPEFEDAPVGPGPAKAHLDALLAEAEARGRSAVQAETVGARKAADEARSRSCRLVESLEAQRTAWAAETRESLAPFVLAAVERIICDARPVREAMLRARLSEICEHLVRARELVLRVAPDDIEGARQIIGDRPGWRVVASPDVRAGAEAEADGGRIDGSLGAALEGLQEALEEWKEMGAPP